MSSKSKSFSENSIAPCVDGPSCAYELTNQNIPCADQQCCINNIPESMSGYAYAIHVQNGKCVFMPVQPPSIYSNANYHYNQFVQSGDQNGFFDLAFGP